ncbi:MAG: prolyl oligopeptidase family serine peptidase [Alphaproteobacteria bacterium]|nr:prolyl oligopeptidase family serine peptidase [Alphaproteobacteria bacterium]
MRVLKRAICAAVLAAALCRGGGDLAAQPALVREDLAIPSTRNGGAVQLVALALRPAGAQARALAIVNHGSPRDAAGRRRMTTAQYESQLRVFAERGYAAVAVLRRGYGSSGGAWAEGYNGCADPDFAAGARRTANDISDAIAHLQTLPWVDRTRVVAIGQSAGGIGVVALAASPPEGLRAIVNFAGGRGSRGPNDVCFEDRLVTAFAAFGRGASLPSLWIYAENDLFFRPELARRFERAYSGAGGRATLLVVPPSGDDGHNYFRRELRDWPERVFPFLRALGLPG